MPHDSGHDDHDKAHDHGGQDHGGHDHGGHEHGGHDHGAGHRHVPSATGARTRRALAFALVLTAGFALVEAIGGYLAGSLALISDAGHMVTDAAALALALFAHAIGRRPASSRASYGYGRAEVLAAFVNALAMLAIVLFIAVEAVRRLLEPVPVAGGMVTVIGSVGLAVNVAAAGMLWRASAESLNARGALLHVMGDLLGSFAAIVAGVVIMVTGWTPIDPILSVVVALLIVRSTWQLLRQSTGVLMEGVPRHLDYDAIGRSLAALPGVVDVHDLHVWNMGSNEVALSAHLSIGRGDAWLPILAQARRMLATDYAIRHATLQPTWPVAPVIAGSDRVIALVPVAPDDGHEHSH
ncbi:MAG: cation transporter [Burkholderiales bacterium]|nr:cation transporter [Burkholderiales bacterium]